MRKRRAQTDDAEIKKDEKVKMEVALVEFQAVARSW